MIEFILDQPNEKVYLKFFSEHFDEMLTFCHLVGLKFLKQEKLWVGTYQNIYNLLPLLDTEDIEFTISEEIRNLIQPKIGVKLKRRNFDISLFKSTPLGSYQIEDTKKMLYTNGIINGSEVGLGKTIETITTLNHLFKNKEIDKVIIVTFAQALYNWKRELLKFSTFCTSNDICIPTLLERNPLLNNPKVIICSYNMFVLMEKFFFKEKFSEEEKKLTKYSRTPYIPFGTWGHSRAIILDEAHSIKNRNAVRTKSLLRHKNYFNFKYLLTATPYPNGAEELYCLLSFIDENIIYAPYNLFVRKIAYVGTKFDPDAIQTDYKTKKKKYKIDQLNNFLQQISPYIFRRFDEKKTKQHIKKLYVEMDTRQRSIYQKIISERLESIKEEKGFIKVKDVINSFPYLTLACSDPSILKNKLTSKQEIDIEGHTLSKSIQEELQNWDFEWNSKLSVCSDILSENNHEKIIIWSTHPCTIDLLGQYYKKYDPIVIHGTSHSSTDLTKEEFRDRLLLEFKQSKKRNLIIMNPAIMGTAINIEESTISIFFDRNYDVKEYLQALGRNHRGTSERDVTAYILINDETLENRLDYMLENKMDINRYLLEYESLTLEEWKKIFSGVIENGKQ